MRGGRRKRPDKLHADKGYDFPRCRQVLGRRGIKCRIARRGIESSERLGRHRWVVETTQPQYPSVAVIDDRIVQAHHWT